MRSIQVSHADLPVIGKRAKQRQAGVDCLRLLQWLAPLPIELREGKAITLLRKVFSEQFVVQEAGKVEAVKVHATGVVKNPHDPEAEWSAKGNTRRSGSATKFS